MIRLIFAFVLSFQFWVFAELTKEISVDAPEGYTEDQIITFSWTLKNDSKEILKNQKFLVYAPVAQTSFQFCEKLKSDHEFQLISDKFHNQILRFPIYKIAPYQTINIRVIAHLKMSETAQSISINSQEFLEGSKKIQVFSEVVKDTLSKIKQPKPFPIYSWVSKSIKKTTYQLKERGAKEALTTKNGDCSEFAAAVTALNRKAGIPTQYISGYYCPGNMKLDAARFHDANFFYEGNKWHFLDAHHQNFKKAQNQFITFTVHEGNSQKLMTNNHRYLVAGKSSKNLKVQMK